MINSEIQFIIILSTKKSDISIADLVKFIIIDNYMCIALLALFNIRENNRL